MSKSQASILLIFVFMARGISFLFSKALMKDMSPMSILAVRFILAFIILAVLFHKKFLSADRKCVKNGIILGCLYTVCMTFEMYGLRLVDTGVSALIENMAIVLVPLYVAALTRTLPGVKTMLCAVFAVTGVGFLSIDQGRNSGGGPGIILILLAAMTYAVCILYTEKISHDSDPVAIGIIQLGTMGFLSLFISFFAGGFGLPQTGKQWGMLAILVLVCSCFGFAFQPLGQKYLKAESAAVLTVVNPLTASVLGILAAGEKLTGLKLIGYIIILAVLVFYNISAKNLHLTHSGAGSS
ncbi:MAG: DMT family transporter [Lachnospiraceae bacterium]|nr:DMT family transporter [Lachnospiraceae bacterium]